MKTLKHRKWYSPHGMRRVGQATSIWRMQISACKVEEGRVIYVGTGPHFILTRSGIGLTKKLAVMCAGIPEHRLVLLMSGEGGARSFCADVNRRDVASHAIHDFRFHRRSDMVKVPSL